MSTETVLTPREHRLATALYKAMRYHDESSERTMAWSLRALRLQRASSRQCSCSTKGGRYRRGKRCAERWQKGFPMSEAIDVKAELLMLVETRITCPCCGVTWDFEGDLGDHLVDCPECDAELRVSTS